jgi:hypothetical protein
MAGNAAAAAAAVQPPCSCCSHMRFFHFTQCLVLAPHFSAMHCTDLPLYSPLLVREKGLCGGRCTIGVRAESTMHRACYIYMLVSLHTVSKMQRVCCCLTAVLMLDGACWHAIRPDGPQMDQQYPHQIGTHCSTKPTTARLARNTPCLLLVHTRNSCCLSEPQAARTGTHNTPDSTG